ncbi:MAG: DUF2129 domain-containing protein [Candidatus Izemoplasmatales bacterium]|nr:DUF2129 domain-containing protein [Candidatus Izemoplasmatales bacterium]MDD3865217.1 DUF2129 domain-containing protein [Candidatus Izemoplasmatales bacterium]
MVSRKGITIYYVTPKVRQEIERQGVNIVYQNDKRNYLTGYIDTNQYDRIKKQLEAMKNIKKVEESLVDMDVLAFTE